MDLVIVFSLVYVCFLAAHIVSIYRNIKKKKKAKTVFSDLEDAFAPVVGFSVLGYSANAIDMPRNYIAVLAFIFSMLFGLYCVGRMIIKYYNAIE